MGFRFSKRITIVSGVRLNISSRGVITSIGPQGLSVTMGRNGTFLNAGLPGPGLSYRQRLDGTRQTNPARTFDTDGYTGSIKVRVKDDGTLLITDEQGNALPPAVAKRARTEQAAAIEALLQKAAEKLN